MKLVICDIDGCLTEGKNIPLVLSNLKSIKEVLKKKEVKISLCTGRSQPYVELFCQILDIKLPCICENGSYLYFPETDSLQLNALISKKYLKELKIIKNKIIPSILNNNHYKFEPCKDYCLSINTKKPVEDIFHIIKDYINSEIFEITYSSSAIDISASGICKGGAMDSLYEKITPTETIGIGDSIADISFLNKCNYILSPSNAHLDVRNISSYVSKYPYSKGVNDILTNSL